MDRFQNAARLRVEEGMSYKGIARELGIPVGTVYDWTSKLPLSPGGIAERRRRSSPEAVAARAAAWSARCRARRLAYQEEGRAKARELDGLHYSGCMLYWAEGAKSRNTVLFANSDMNMVVFFRRFLGESLGVTADRLALRIHAYTTNGLSIEEIERRWLDALELPRACVRKHCVDSPPTSSSGKRSHKLTYGVCTLRVLRSTPIVQHIYGAIQEYAGFDEPRWLD